MEFDDQFNELVSKGGATGEVVAVQGAVLEVRGLGNVSTNSVIRFQNGSRGLVFRVERDRVVILQLGIDPTQIGDLAVYEEDEYNTPVGDGLLGRVINVHGEPLDGKGEVALSSHRQVFAEAPTIMERGLVNEQLETGVLVIDSLLPIVKGQRIAILGDSKVGKTSAMLQLAARQAEAGNIVVLTLIAHKSSDIDYVVRTLDEKQALQNCVIIASRSFDSLVDSYVAPYVGCAIAEHFWFEGRDVVSIYDDLTTHAHAYRELSLLLKKNPGRGSYPGDMFHAQATLLERAGKLSRNNASLSAIPVVLTPDNDITAFLPTNIISITDGQIVFDAELFRRGVYPSVNIGLSVSRVGGRAQDAIYKELAARALTLLTKYKKAESFTHFGSELAVEASRVLVVGDRLKEVLQQTRHETYGIHAQQVMLQAVLDLPSEATFDVGRMKQFVFEHPDEVEAADVSKAAQALAQQFTMELKS